MTCSQCQTSLTDDAKFCPQCGKKVPPKYIPQSAPREIKPSDLMTAQELANLLRVSDDTVYAMVHAKQIPFRHVRRQLRFPGWLIINWLEGEK